MQRIFLAVAALITAMASPHAARAQGAAEATVTIAPEASGNWSVTYEFAEEQSVLVFARSASDYRDMTWSLVSDEARFGRVHGVDVAVLDTPAKSVEFSIVPLTSTLVGDYTPFVTFTDGSIAVYEGQFSLVPVADMDAVEALEGTTSNLERAPLTMDVVLSSDKPIIVDGAVQQGSVRHRVEGDGTYIYTGDGKIERFGSFTAVIDSSLPAWLRERFDSDLSDIFSRFEAMWGFKLEHKATVMLAYKGGSTQGFSATGGALDQLLMMEIGGDALNEANPDLLSYLHWFFAHEAVHLFQIDKGIEFASGEQSWIHEGAANTMAYNLVASMQDEGAREAFLKGVYGGAFDECVSVLETGPLETAGERDAFSAHYSCGDFVALATDGFLKRRNLYGFWNRLVAHADGASDKRVDMEAYFTVMDMLGATKGQQKTIRAVVDGKPSNPRKALTDMLEAAGLDPKFSAGGQLVSLDWPDYTAE